MQEFFIMIGLSLILAVAAFAESAPVKRPVVPHNGTATFVITNTATSSSTNTYRNETTKLPDGVSTSIPSTPRGMPPEPTKPTGFN
jgi:hypothetical protein